MCRQILTLITFGCCDVQVERRREVLLKEEDEVRGQRSECDQEHGRLHTEHEVSEGMKQANYVQVWEQPCFLADTWKTVASTCRSVWEVAS